MPVSQASQSQQGAARLAQALEAVFISPNESDSNLEAANVVDGLYQGARIIAKSIRDLGNADASSPMGAIEAHGTAVKEGAEMIADALGELQDGAETIAAALGTVAEALDRIAAAIERQTGAP